MSEDRPGPVIPAPDAMRRVAKQLREITAYQALQPLERVLAGRVRTILATSLDELARIREDPALVRERRLQERVDQLAILATSRRLPLEAVAGLVRLAKERGQVSVSVGDLESALARTEADL